MLLWLVGIGLLEIAGFILVGRWLGLMYTLLLIMLTSGAGLYMLKSTAKQMGVKAQEAMQAGAVNPNIKPKYAVRLFSGLLLLIPGFFTDILGLLIFIPAIRKSLMAMMSKKFGLYPGMGRAKGQQHSAANDHVKPHIKPHIQPHVKHHEDKGRVIEGEFTEKKDAKDKHDSGDDSGDGSGKDSEHK